MFPKRMVKAATSKHTWLIVMFALLVAVYLSMSTGMYAQYKPQHCW